MSRKFSDYARTQAELAGVLGVGTRTVRDWSAAGMSCFDRELGYSIPAAIRWARENRWEGRGGQSSDSGGGRKEIAELRKLEADAEAKEIRVQQQMGALVDRDAVNGAIGDLLNDVRDRLVTVADEVAEVAPEQFRRDLRFNLANRLRLILTEINTWEASRHGAGGNQAIAEEKEETDTANAEGIEMGVAELLEGAGE